MSSELPIGRWPWSDAGEGDLAPKLQNAKMRGSPLRTQKREFLSSKRSSHGSKR